MCLSLPILTAQVTQKKSLLMQGLIELPENVSSVTKEMLIAAGFNRSALTKWEEKRPVLLQAAKLGFFAYHSAKDKPVFNDYLTLLTHFGFTRTSFHLLLGYRSNYSTVYQVFSRNREYAIMIVMGCRVLVDQRTARELCHAED